MKYFVTSKISDNQRMTPEGFLLCLGVPIARTGDMEYVRGEVPIKAGKDGKVIVYRDPKEVFSPKTIASFEGKPITIGHPDDDVNPKNWRDLANGSMQNVRRGTGELDDSLLADLLITDDEAINLVKEGLREVSCGYDAYFVEDEEGKGHQENIIGNHLALVEEGRAGPEYAIKDHKGKGDSEMKAFDKIKEILAKKTKGADSAKVLDEVMKVISDENPDADKTKDAYDEMSKKMDAMCDSISAMKDAIEGMGKKEGSDDADPPAPPAKKEDEDKSKDADPMQALSDRLAAVEKMLAKMGDEDVGDEDPDSAEDEEGEEGEVVGDEDTEDNDFDESSMAGDTKANVEILAPGTKFAKDAKEDVIKVEALKKAYATADGKKVIDVFTKGKTPAYDSKKDVNFLFDGAAALLKANRTKEFAKTKKVGDFNSSMGTVTGAMTAEEINKKNEAHYSKRN